MAPAIVALEQVSVRRAGRSLLRDIDWQVREGEHWAILGPNGAGKTTLLRIASAQIHPSRGAATVLGGRFGRVSLPELRTRIGVVEPGLARSFYPEQRVLDVVLSGVTGTIFALVDDDRARQALQAVGLGGFAGRLFSTCSEGERARAMLARALIADAPLLVLDEPAAGLDLPGRELMLEALTRVAAERPGLTTLTATHHLEELPASTTHALLLRGGAVVAAGPLEQALREETLAACFGLPLTIERSDGGRLFVRAAARY
jgi:iron complex transport system ATP-binding protein